MTDFTQLLDLASERLGGAVLAANDEFFAPKENLLRIAQPVFFEDRYTDRGKWMDGWETRRRRTPGNDWCVIRLGLPGIVRGVLVDTGFFRGNFPSQCSLEACSGGDDPLASDVAWRQILAKSELEGDAQNLFAISDPYRSTCLRFNIFPDGGVARLRVYGEVLPDWKSLLATSSELDLASVANGGRPVASSDMFFSAPLNLLMPDRPANMSDGWETRRRRGPGHDWTVVQLGIAGEIRRVEVDTAHFKGNYPESCSLEACSVSDLSAHSLANVAWSEILPRTPLGPDHRHVFEEDLRAAAAATHVRFNIFPDGGVARLRVFGRPEATALQAMRLEWLNALEPHAAAAALGDCCGSLRWTEYVIAQRPYAHPPGLYAAAEDGFAHLDGQDWREAFRHHPRLGEKQAAAARSVQAQAWSAQEQSGIDSPSASSRARFQQASRAYEERFGYIFLACASGKSLDELLALLEARMNNSAEKELGVAGEEQRKITRLRLERLLEP